MIIKGIINPSRSASAGKPILANRYHAGVNGNVEVLAIINCTCL